MIDTSPRSSDRAPAMVRACLLSASAVVAGCSGGDLALPQPSAGMRLALVSGNQQTGRVGEQLPKPLIVELRDAQGNAVIGRRVAFVITDGPAAAELAPDTAVTDGEGQAVGQWTLGKTPGEYHAEARVILTGEEPVDVDPATMQFLAAAVPGRPDTLRATSKDAQAAPSGGELTPVVVVVDRFGNPVPGVAVHWNASGSGSVSESSTLTGADGRATVTWTVGKRIGAYQLTASISGDVTGSPATFTAIVFF